MRLKLQFRTLIRVAGWPLLFVVALFFLSAGSAQATNYFSWGAEGETVLIDGGSAPIYGYHGNTSRNCSIAHTGSCSMRLLVDDLGSDESEGLDIDQNPLGITAVGSGSIYYRWWMRVNPGFSWGTNTAKVKSSRVGLSTGTGQGYTGYIGDFGFLIGECSDAGCLTNTGANNTDSNLNIPYTFADDGAWHEYIVRVKPNTSASCTAGTNCNAELQAYVDGVSVGTNYNWKMTNQGSATLTEFWGGWMTSPYFQLNGSPGDGGTIYIDDISTDNVWNSTFAGSDTTPPAAPSGLGVQ